MVKLLVKFIRVMPRKTQWWLCSKLWFMKWVVKNETYFRERRVIDIVNVYIYHMCM